MLVIECAQMLQRFLAPEKQQLSLGSRHPRPIAWKSNGIGRSRTIGKAASKVGQTRYRYAAERAQSHS